MPRLSLTLPAALLVASCASSPDFDTSDVDVGLSPPAAAERAAAVGTRVLWGGIVLAGENRPDHTRLEVVGYPLDRRQRPDTGAAPIGRFLVEQESYLELADYAPGKHVTVIGPVKRVDMGNVGEARYRYPVVGAEQLHVWPRESATTAPAFHFGVGVIFSR